MPVELARAQDLAKCAPSGSADKDDACRILMELKVLYVLKSCPLFVLHFILHILIIFLACQNTIIVCKD